MKVVQILDNRVHWITPYASLDSAPPFADNIILVEAPDWIDEGWRYIDGEWLEPLPSAIIEFDMRKAKIKEISDACYNIIVSGIDVELGGEIKHFSLEPLDQINIGKLEDKLANGLLPNGVPYHADDNRCKIYTAEEFELIARTATNHIFWNQTYCSHLMDYIRLCNEEELSTIIYGMELPSDLAEDMAMILAAMM